MLADEPIRTVRGPIAPLLVPLLADDRGDIQPTRLSYAIYLGNGMPVTNPGMFPDDPSQDYEGEREALSAPEDR